MTANEKLTASMIKIDKWLENTIMPSERAYIKGLRDALEKINLVSKGERTRYRELERKIADIVGSLGAKYKTSLTAELGPLENKAMYDYEVSLAQALIGEKPSTDLAKLILNMDLPVSGINQSMNDLIFNVVSYTNRKLRQEIGNLYLEGKTLDEITYILAKSYRANAADSKALRTITHNLRTTTNTIISIGREQGRAKAENEYLKYIDGWLFDAVRDSRTTTYCINHDQRFYSKDDFATRNDIKDSEGYVFVPHHYNCRSMLIPISNEEAVANEEDESLMRILAPKGEFEGVGEEFGTFNKDGISVFTSEYGSTRYVFADDGDIVSALQVVSRDGENGIVSNIYTLIPYRREGISTKLYEKALSQFETLVFSDDLSELGKLFMESVS